MATDNRDYPLVPYVRGSLIERITFWLSVVGRRIPSPCTPWDPNDNHRLKPVEAWHFADYACCTNPKPREAP